MTAKRYIERLGRLRSQASTFRAHYRELAKFISPRRSRFEATDYTRAGSKMNQSIVNNTATRAKRILSSGMMAGMTSPARPWFRLRVSDIELNENKEVKSWLQTVERRILEAMARSNLYNGLALVYDDLGVFGTSSLYIEEHPLDIARVHVPPVGSYYLALDEYYRVNAVYRVTTLSVEQLVRRFGLEAVSVSTRTAYARGSYDERREVLHIIEPNDLMIEGMLDHSGMPWRSVWVETGTAGDATGTDTIGSQNSQVILGHGGFREWPCPSPRWSVTGEDAYGSSPGMEALGDVRALQHMERRRAQALDKIVTPPMVGPSLLRRKRVSLIAGDVTYADIPAQRQEFKPAFMVDPKVVFLDTELARHEQRINSTFFADLFLMLATSGVRQPITAREVDERHEEKMLQLGPVLERLEDELLDPTISRYFGIMSRRGMFPPPPRALEGKDAKPQYISILAEAQKLLAIVGVERLAGFTMSLAEANPEVLDKLNFDRAIDEAAELLGTNPDLVRSDDEVRRRRDERASQAQLGVDQAKAAKDAASAAKTAGEAAESPGVQQMLQAFGPAAEAGVSGG